MAPPAAVISSAAAPRSGVRTRTDRSELRWMNSCVEELAISLPRPMTIRWSAVTAISLIRWLETKTVRPSPASCCMKVRTQRMPSGSRPLTGSSSSSTCGSPSIAAAMPSRWVMPSEKPPARLRGHGGQAHQVEDLVDPARRETLRLGEEQQVVAGAAAGMQGPCLEQRADRGQRPRQLPVGQPADRRRSAFGPVQPQDEPHRGRLACAVRAEEAGYPARLHRERQVVHGHLVAESLRQLMRLDEARCLGHVRSP